MIGKIVRITLASLAALIAGAAVLLHTSFFREEMIDFAEEALQSSVRGEVSIGRLEGILLHRATLHDIVIKDAEGRPVIEVDAVRVDPDLMALIFDGVLRFDNVRLVHPRLHLRTDAAGRLNLSELFISTSTPTPDAKSGFTPIAIDLEDARVIDGFVSYAAHGLPEQKVEKVDIWTSAAIRGDRIDVRVLDLELTPSAYPSRLTVRGRAAVLPEQIEVSRLDITDHLGSAVHVRRLVHELATGALRGRFRIEAAAGSLRALTQEQDLRGSLSLAGRLEHARIDAPWSVRAKGKLNRAPLTLSATASADFAELAGALELHGPIDPAELHAIAPRGSLQGTIAVTLRDPTPARLTGTLTTHLVGSVRYSPKVPRLDVRSFDLDGAADQGALRVSGRIDANRARGTFRLAGRVDEGRLELAPSQIDLNVDELTAVIPPGLGVGGAVAVNAKLSGSTEQLRVSGEVRATNLKSGAFHLDRGRAGVELSGSIEQLRGRADVTLERMSSGATDLGSATLKLARSGRGPWQIDLKSKGAEQISELVLIASGQLEPERVRLGVERLEVLVFERRWKSERRATVAATSRPRGWLIEVADLTLAGKGGKVAASARADLGAERLESANVQAEGIDLVFVRSLISGQKTGPSGTGSLSAVVANDHADVKAKLTGPRLGTAEVTAAADLPKRSLDPKSYQRVTAELIERAEVVLADVDLEAVQGALGVVPSVRGIAGGRISMARGGGELEASLDLRKGHVQGLSERVELTVHLEKPKAGPMTGNVAAMISGRKVLDAELQASVPLRQLQKEGLAALYRSSGTLKAKLDRMPLSAIPMEQGQSVTGSVSGDVSIVKKGDDLEIDLEATSPQLHWDPSWPDVDVALTAHLRKGKMSADGSVDAGKAGRIELTAKGDTPAQPLSIESWEKLGIAAIESAVVEVKRGDLSAFGELLDIEPLAGQITGKLTVSKGGRSLSGGFEAVGLVAPRLPNPIDARAHLTSKGGATSAHADVFDRDRPLITAEVSLPLDLVQLSKSSSAALAVLPVEGEFHADRLPVAMVAALLEAEQDASGSISIDGHMTGAITDPQLEVRLESDDARIRTAAFEKIEATADFNRLRLITRVLMKQRHGGQLDVDATIGIRKQQEMKGRMKASKFDLGFLSLIAPKTKGTVGGVAGRMDADVTLSGTSKDPHFDGKVNIAGLRAVMMFPIPPVDDTNLEVTLHDDQLKFGVEGRSGEGTFKVHGEGSLPSIRRPRLNGTIELTDLALAAGPRLIEADVEAKWEVRQKNTMIEASILITDGDAKMEAGGEDRIAIQKFDQVVVVNNLGEARGYTPDQVIEGDKGPIAPPMAFRLTIKTEEPVPLRSDDINASVSTDLVFETSPAGLIGKGAIVVTDGTIELFGGRRWIIDSAEITFPGGVDEEPRLSIGIYYDFSDVVVHVRVTGVPSNPEVTLTSDPPNYSRDQLLGFVLGGSPDSAESDATLGSQAVGVAAGFLVGKIQEKLEDNLPIDTLSVDVPDGERAGAVLVGKWITERIFVAYNYRIQADEDENAMEGILRVLFGHGWMLEAAYGDHGNGAADLLWITRF